jgi:purine-nucleoside phosphorylase
MNEYLTIEQIDQLADRVRSRLHNRPTVGLILGSGLGTIAEAVKDPTLIPYQDLPGWPVSTVVGHQGRLVAGTLDEVDILVMQGRTHYYEGYPISLVGLPVRVMQRLGITTLIVTNAAGAVNPEFMPGDLMLITDHLNIMGMAGLTPLRGPNLDLLGPRFPDMSQPYDHQLVEIARQVAVSKGITLREGVYVCLAGPSFETPADLRYLRSIGADAVGMSTVPEVTVARHGGQRVLGISGISNKANLDGSTVTTHEEVLAAGPVIVPKLDVLLRGVLKKMV